jgi:hypothetical protein
MPENSREKREKNLKRIEENRTQYDEAVRRMKAQLDRIKPSSSSRKPLEKALKRLISQGPTVFDELSAEDFDE